MPIERLTESSRPRYVIDQILSSIQDRTLKPEERLPSEAKLAELTGVGRTSVREALAALRLMGVVETRVGDGSYVAAAADLRVISKEITHEIARAISASEEALQLQEARAVFEAGMVRLAAERWSAEKAKEFENLLSQMSKAAESEGYADYIRLHREPGLRPPVNGGVCICLQGQYERVGAVPSDGKDVILCTVAGRLARIIRASLQPR